MILNFMFGNEFIVSYFYKKSNGECHENRKKHFNCIYT